MGAVGTVVAGSLFVVGLATYVHLLRSRKRIMAYHKIETPQINEVSHGTGGSGT